MSTSTGSTLTPFVKRQAARPIGNTTAPRLDLFSVRSGLILVEANLFHVCVIRCQKVCRNPTRVSGYREGRRVGNGMHGHTAIERSPDSDSEEMGFSGRSPLASLHGLVPARGRSNRIRRVASTNAPTIGRNSVASANCSYSVDPQISTWSGCSTIQRGNRAPMAWPLQPSASAPTHRA